MPRLEDTPARDLYAAAVEDRPDSRTWWRWIVTAIAGLLQLGDAPTASQIVIRRHDGAPVRTIESSWVGDLDATLAEVERDLSLLDAAAFADAWLREPA